MPRNKKITCEEIAAHFNLNKSTVSRALSGKGSMREELRQEIIEYARKEGYISAHENKEVKRTKNIAVVLPRNLLDNSVFFAESLVGGTSGERCHRGAGGRKFAESADGDRGKQ